MRLWLPVLLQFTVENSGPPNQDGDQNLFAERLARNRTLLFVREEAKGFMNMKYTAEEEILSEDCLQLLVADHRAHPDNWQAYSELWREQLLERVPAAKRVPVDFWISLLTVPASEPAQAQVTMRHRWSLRV